MTVDALLEELRNRGIVLSASGERLAVDAPRGVVNPELLAALKQRKAEILTALQSERPATGYGLCPGPDKCGGCYSVGVIDGRERFIHPPKVSPDWRAWLTKWQPKKGNPIQ